MAAKDSLLLQENPDAWSSSWEMATATFTAAATAAGARLERLDVDPALDGTPLWVDVAVWGTSTTHILLYTAGIHGVEGYAGSAVLTDLCQQMQQHATSDAVKIIFVHVLNPAGMHSRRRWNENNVDLNRNTLATEQDYVDRRDNPNPTYVKYDEFLNPTTPLGACDCFAPRLVCLICKEGFNNGKQALAGGQAHTARGLFYGGVQWEATPALVFGMLAQEGLSRDNAALRSCFHVDIHTGVGPWQHDSLLAENCFLPKLEQIFQSKGDLNKAAWHLDGIGTWVAFVDEEEGEGKEVGGPTLTTGEAKEHDEAQQRDAQDGVAYTAKGHVGGGLFYKNTPKHMQRKGADWISVTQEFGTLKGTKMFQLLRAENALTSHVKATLLNPLKEGGGTAEEVARDLMMSPQRTAVFDAFCPSDVKWRGFVVERGRVVFGRALAHVLASR